MTVFRLLLTAVFLFSLAPSAPAPQPALAVAPPAWAAAQEGEITYVVQKGDSLYRIAARFNITVEALVAANNLATTTLQPGQVLIIPGTVAPAPAEPAAAPEAAAPPPDTPNTIYARIRGSAAFTQRVRTALEWMQTRDPASFQRVEDYVTVIVPSNFAYYAVAVPLPGGLCEVRALARPGMSVGMTAALLYHEASHCQQFATEGILPNRNAEIYAYGEQLSFMWRNGFSQEELDYYYRILDYYKAAPDDGTYVRPPNF